MKRNAVCFFLFLALLFLPLSAGAVMLMIPGGVEIIESEAFSSIGNPDAVFLPQSVTSISPDAFSDASFQVYGFPGSAAQAFAEATGRDFVSVAISDLGYTGKVWAQEGAAIPLTASAVSAFWPIEYRFELLRDGSCVFSTDYSTSFPVYTFNDPGTYSVGIHARHLYAEGSALIKDAIVIEENIRFASETLTVGTGRTICALDAGEDESVSLVSGDESVFTVSGHTICGVSPGTAYLTARKTTSGGEIVCAAPVTVYQAVSEISVPNAPEMLFPGESVLLIPEILPDDAENAVPVWSSSNEEAAVVTQGGILTAVSPGEAVISITADEISESFVLTTGIPMTGIEITGAWGNVVLTHETISLSAAPIPENASLPLFSWKSMNPSVARVSEDGQLTGVSIGNAQILCFAEDGSGVYAAYDVTVLKGVESVLLSLDSSYLFPGDVMALSKTVLPADALDKSLVFSSGNPAVAKVDENGVVTAVAPGITAITAKASNGVSASVTVKVLSADRPAAVLVSPSSCVLSPGDALTLTSSVSPSAAESTVVWRSADPSIASVSENGTVKAVSSGTCYIYAASAVDEDVFATCKVTVLNDARTLTMPYRRTGTGEVSENLSRISSVKASAFLELESLYAKGKISSSVMNERKAVISNAFSMYSFPWMTKSYQEYWKAENSENGAKDFKPGTVYYGMPYISDYQNRLYNVSKAVSENRYTAAAKGYYLNQNNLLNGKYVGNDCSSMLSISFFGFTSKTANFNTRSFYSTELFTTLSSSSVLMPGDILVRNGRHVVMFLYYANSAKTQIVVIEQGGSEAGINTVSTGLYPLSHYYNNSYIPRRLTEWT